MLGIKRLFCNQKRQRFAYIFAVSSVILIMAAAAIFSCFDWQLISDESKAAGFKPSDEVAEIADSLQLTRHGRAAFYAARPELLDGDALNARCGRDGESSYTLGCYLGGTNERIAIYDIGTDVVDENGVYYDFDVERKMTAMHEFLHAVYERLDSRKQSAVCREAKTLVGSLAELRQELQLYSGDQYCTEAFARVGVEYRDKVDSSSMLATTYGRYYELNEDLLEQYRQNKTQLAELRDRALQTREKMSATKKLISAATARYYSSLSYRVYREANAQIDNYNAMLTDYNSLATTYRKIIRTLDSEQ